ncbi:MAG: DNA methyltransferase [Acidiferrobacteraceae bacterium]
MNRLEIVPLDKIHWNKRYREDLGDIDSLAESMQEKGVLQPITITPDYELLAGERRVTAARKAGLVEIPALVRSKEDAIDAREIELMENVLRKDFTWSERCALEQEIDRLYKEKNLDWSGRKTAQLLSRSQSSISRDLQLAKAIEDIPELAEYKTADEAYKVLKKLEEDAIVTTLRERQSIAMNNDGLERGLKLALKLADSNYHIGDTFKGLAELRSDGLVHVIECDPPYGIDLASVKSSKDSPTSNVHSYNEIDKSEYPAFIKRLAKELYRVAGQHAWLVFWFGPTWQHETITALRDSGWQVDDIPAIWAKPNGQTLQPELYLGRAYEPFFLARKGKPVLMKRGRLNMFNYSGVPSTTKYHPTERPVQLIQDILETLSVPRQVVLVPFLGSGATLRAAYNCGMSAFGWDLNGEYKNRFMLAVEQDSKSLNGESE